MAHKKSMKESPLGQQLHKLNNSLGAILGFSSLLRRHLSDDEVGLEYAAKISEAVRDALERAELLGELELKAPMSSDNPREGFRNSTEPYDFPMQPNILVDSGEGYESLGSSDNAPNSGVDWDSLEGCERLLIVEDDSAFRSLLQTFLSQLGYELVCAEDGIEAVELFSSNPQDYDLVCLDRDLPRMDGFFVASKIRKLRPRIRMILLSGTMLSGSTNELGNQDEIMKLGFSAVLKKPIPLGELALTLRRVLNLPVQ